MDYARIEPGGTYLCVFGDERYRVKALDKSGSLVLVKLDAKFVGGRAVGPPAAAEIGAELWVAPEALEPEPAADGASAIRRT